MRKPLVIGNWKMNGSAARVDALLADLTASGSQLPSIDIVVCPSFVYI
ncbi:MAG: triose-phosphate isomerase, partial [Pseudomonadales bacterium]